MHKNLVLLTLVFLASCHGRPDRSADAGKTFHLRVNPADSSTYRYKTSCETTLTLDRIDSVSVTDRASHLTVSYLISKDNKDIMLDMTFSDIDYHEKRGFGVNGVDAVNEPGPIRELLEKMKTATVFVRILQPGSTVTISGAQEVVNPIMGSYYAEADKAQAGAYWGQWVEQQLVWRNLDPLVWVTLDSARHIGDHWSDTSTNAEDINFKIDKRYQFDGVEAGMARFRSRGHITNERGGTWLMGIPVTGLLTGEEEGECLVDTATGMPTEMNEAIRVEGNVQLEGRKTQIKIAKMIKMMGGKVD